MSIIKNFVMRVLNLFGSAPSSHKAPPVMRKTQSTVKDPVLKLPIGTVKQVSPTEEFQVIPTDGSYSMPSKAGRMQKDAEARRDAELKALRTAEEKRKQQKAQLANHEAEEQNRRRRWRDEQGTGFGNLVTNNNHANSEAARDMSSVNHSYNNGGFVPPSAPNHHTPYNAPNHCPALSYDNYSPSDSSSPSCD